MSDSRKPSAEQSKETLDGQTEMFLRQMLEAERFCGVTLICRNDRVIHKRAYGPVSRHFRNQVGDRFHVASIGKQFTAAAIMQMVETGAVQLDGPVNDFLPEHLRSRYWEAVRVLHLLSHSSGIPDYVISRGYYDVTDGWASGATINGMIREAMAQPVSFASGTKFEYCNLGYTLLGEIIECRSGLRYAEYIQRELLDPLGMTESQIHDDHYQPTPKDAPGLRWDDRLKRHVKDEVVSLPVTPADGGLVTTLDDFVRWTRVYKDRAHPSLLRPSVEQMLATAAPFGNYRWPERNMRGPGFYGLGLMRSGDLVMHEGSIVGFRSFFIYSIESDLLIAVFSNNANNDVFRIASGLFELHG